MWRQIVEELEKDEALGPALPIACHRHPETLEYVCKPGQLPQIAPDGVYGHSLNSSSAFNHASGGCMRPCDFRLNCGHMCPFKVTFFPFGVAYEINIPFSVTAMIRNTPLYRACSHARGFV
jgi:hypothetical protein